MKPADLIVRNLPRIFKASLGLLFAGSFAMSGLAWAQDHPVPRSRPTLKELGIETPADDTRLPATVLPYAPPIDELTNIKPEVTEGKLLLSALLNEGGESIRHGMVWRIYSAEPNSEGELELIFKSAQDTVEIKLNVGEYLVLATYGYVTKMEQVSISSPYLTKVMVLNAGGMKLDAVVNETVPLMEERVLFDIYSMDYDAKGERIPIAKDVKKGQMVRLSADTYHVVSRYGSVNAVVRADMQIPPGKLIEANIHHKAAEITLKLVSESGGEALAGTTWSVLTPEGDTVVEDAGAFPSFILAEGEYEVIAKYRDEEFSRNFSVVSGSNQEVEVLAVQ